MSAIFTQYVLTLVATLNCAFSAGVVLTALLSAQSVPDGVPRPRPTVGLSVTVTFPDGLRLTSVTSVCPGDSVVSLRVRKEQEEFLTADPE